jgi:hypothetical protein
MTLELTSDVATGLAVLAAERGISVEEYLREMVAHELAAAGQPLEMNTEESSGMVLENGLFVYGAGTALPSDVIDNAIRRSREDRSRHVFGDPH